MSKSTQGPLTSFSSRRLEAFSDGVFAIAITLLVLEIATHPGGSPLHEVLGAWPAYVSYVVSFLTIGAAWIGHTAQTEKLTKVDSVYLQLNILLLLVVAFLPFPTKLVTEAFGDRDAERVAVTFYGLTLIAIKIMGLVLDAHARRAQLYDANAVAGDAEPTLRKSFVALAGYLVAIVLGVFLPGVAVAAYFAVAFYLIIPFREFVQLGHRRGQPGDAMVRDAGSDQVS